MTGAGPNPTRIRAYALGTALVLGLLPALGSSPVTAQQTAHYASPVGNPAYAPGMLTGAALEGGGMYPYGPDNVVPVSATALEMGAATMQPPTYTPHGLPYTAPPAGEISPEYGVVPKGLGKLITTQRYDDHWYDLRFEAVNFKRSDDSVSDLVTTRRGVSGTSALRTRRVFLNQSEELGGRTILAFDLFSSFDMELLWMGGFDWSEGARADSATNSLFSVFSDFGITPPQGFVETDQATTHTLLYESELDNWEMNFRWRWSHTTNPWTGAWVLGVRYLKLVEKFRHTTFASAHTDPITGFPRGPGAMDYIVDTTNDLVGFQMGAEVMTSPLQSLLIGVDGKVGIYGNHAVADTDITATSIPGGLTEEQEGDKAAFIGEVSAMALYRIYKEVYVRLGYEGLFIQGVALAPSNFNTASPFTPGRPQVYSNNGHVFYHGWYAGLECQW